MKRWKTCSGRKTGGADKQDPDVPPKASSYVQEPQLDAGAREAWVGCDAAGTGALRAQSSLPGDLLHLPPKTAEGERGGDRKRLTTAEWLQVSPLRHPRAPGVLRRTNTRSQLRPASVCPAHVCTLRALSLGWDKRGGQVPRGAVYGSK